MLPDTARFPALEQPKPLYRKKLIEVALPLAAINEAAKHEKHTTNGHPSTFHLWWGHRPYVVARALMVAALLDDPSSRTDLYPTEKEQGAARELLLDIVASAASWKGGFDRSTMDKIRAAIALHHEGALPIVVDPFSGRGTLPLEAQRLGLNTLGYDLNPVAVLISKALIEIPWMLRSCSAINPTGRRSLAPPHGVPAIVADVAYYGKKLVQDVKARLQRFYPDFTEADGTTATIQGWLWARTAVCPNPICGNRTPLVRSSILSRKKASRATLAKQFSADRKQLSFVVSPDIERDSFSNIIPKRGATCMFCNEPVSLKYLRAEGKRGNLSTTLLGAITTSKGRKRFLSSNEAPGHVPDISLPDDALSTELVHNSRHMGPTVYGFARHRDLYTRRQLLALTTFADTIKSYRSEIEADARDHSDLDRTDLRGLEDGGSGPTAYADGIVTYLALALSRLTDRFSTLLHWQDDETVGHVFERPALSMTWDFMETNPLTDASGSYLACLKGVLDTLAKAAPNASGVIAQSDARQSSYPEHTMIFTDPPYYDNIPYADVADYFYVWLRRSLADVWPSLFATLETPKTLELTMRGRGDRAARTFGREAFVSGFSDVFANWTQQIDGTTPSIVFYAFRAKEEDIEADDAEEGAGADISSEVNEGWESMLRSLIDAGLQITGSWPLNTERSTRRRSVGSNALGFSIALVCRPRRADAPTCTRAEFIRELQSELPGAVASLRDANIAATDLEQASFGPGIGIYSKFAAVLEPDDRPMTVRTALGLINNELAHVIIGQLSDVDPETQVAITLYAQQGFEPGDFSHAEVLFRTKSASRLTLKAYEVLETDGGVIRLKGPRELQGGPTRTLSAGTPVWVHTLHLIGALVREDGGETAAADVLRSIPRSLVDQVKNLAYHCFRSSDDAKRMTEARDFSALISAWPVIERIAAQRPVSQPLLTDAAVTEDELA